MLFGLWYLNIYFCKYYQLVNVFFFFSSVSRYTEYITTTYTHISKQTSLSLMYTLWLYMTKPVFYKYISCLVKVLIFFLQHFLMLAVKQSSWRSSRCSDWAAVTPTDGHVEICHNADFLLFPKRSASLAERKQELFNQTALLPYPDLSPAT